MLGTVSPGPFKDAGVEEAAIQAEDLKNGIDGREVCEPGTIT